MKRTSLLLAASLFGLLLTSPAAHAQGVWEWGIGPGGLGGQASIAGSALGRDGDAYITGYADSAFTLGSFVVPPGAFVARLDSMGQARWFRTLAGPEVRPRALALDSAGGVYVAGAYRGTLQLDAIILPGDTLNYDAFVTHCSPSGQWQWAVPAGSADGRQEASAITVSNFGEIWVSGDFDKAFTLGATQLIPVGLPSLNSVFVGLLSSAGQWQQAWQTRGYGFPSRINVASMATDNAANVYLTGTFTGVVHFGADSLTRPMGTNTCGYIAKLSPLNGGWQWARQWGDVAYSQGLGVVIEPESQDPILCGSFTGSLTLGGYRLGPAGGLLARLDGPTGDWDWGQQTGIPLVSGGATLQKLAITPDGRLYTAGAEREPAVGISFPPVPTFGNGAVFIATAELAGGDWVQVWRNNNNTAINVEGLAVNAGPRVLLTGIYGIAAPGGSFPPVFGAIVLPAATYPELRLLAVSLRDTRARPMGLASEPGQSAGLTLAPNPALSTTMLTLPAPAASAQRGRVVDALGRTVRTFSIPAGQQTVTVPVAGLAPGLYRVQVAAAGTRLVVE